MAGEKELTRIMVRRMATEPNTALAGVILEISFARFSPSMATFSEERAPSRPFGCWDLAAMAKTQDSCEKAVRRGQGCEGEGFYSRREHFKICDSAPS